MEADERNKLVQDREWWGCKAREGLTEERRTSKG